MQALVEGFQRAFAADGIPEKHSHKVHHVVVAETAADKVHTLTDLGQNILRDVGVEPARRLHQTRMADRAQTEMLFG